MKSKLQLVIFSAIMLLMSIPAHCQSMQCTIKSYHSVCTFSDGNVVETFTRPGHYAQYTWTAPEWSCQSKHLKGNALTDCLYPQAPAVCDSVNDPLSPACEKQQGTKSLLDEIPR